MTQLADPGATISVAAVTDETRGKAIAYLTRKGHEDLLPVLGLCGTETIRGPKAVACPRCGAAVGAVCKMSEGRDMTRSHQRRISAAAMERAR